MSNETELISLINQIEDRELRSKIHVTLEDYLDELNNIEDEIEEYVDPYEGYDKKLISTNGITDQQSGIKLNVCEYEYSKEGCETAKVFITRADSKLYGLPNDLLA